jgi:FkbM family methyltransferase
MGRPGNAPTVGSKVLRELGQIVRSMMVTRSLTYTRILWHVLRKPRFSAGTVRFPFGRVRYVDALSLRNTYLQLFVERVYDVVGLGAAPTILDCGGNIGLSVIAFKRRYPHAHVTVFEPDPSIARTLAANLQALHLDDVAVLPVAAAGTEGCMTFLPDGADGGRIIAAEKAGDVSGAISVRTVRLSEHIHAPVDLLKLDVEGSEYGIIADLCQSGRIALVKMLVCEVHGNPDVQVRFAHLWEQLTQAGFRLSLRYARLGASKPRPPFAVIPGVYFAVHLYAWRP